MTPSSSALRRIRARRTAMRHSFHLAYQLKCNLGIASATEETQIHQHDVWNVGATTNHREGQTDSVNLAERIQRAQEAAWFNSTVASIANPMVILRPVATPSVCAADDDNVEDEGECGASELSATPDAFQDSAGTGDHSNELDCQTVASECSERPSAEEFHAQEVAATISVQCQPPMGVGDVAWYDLCFLIVDRLQRQQNPSRVLATVAIEAFRAAVDGLPTPLWRERVPELVDLVIRHVAHCEGDVT
mmetsp:Transcript_47095/g.86362  ORF Transcript_47095/g.86362 Transcript_47095/m.86362 type:complete len:248 (-) Transcript_47095:53-796(-)